MTPGGRGATFGPLLLVVAPAEDERVGRLRLPVDQGHGVGGRTGQGLLDLVDLPA